MGANIAPKKCIELYESIVVHRDLEKAKLLYKDLLPLLNLLETEPYPVQSIKYLLSKKNWLCEKT